MKLAVLLLAAVSGYAANTITLTNTGSTTSNYPVQIGRAFVAGEIPNGSLPQASIGGVGAVSTQVDVKARWADSSLKYAILSFLVPSFTGSSTITVTFAAGTTVGNTALTQAQMLAAGFNFNAVFSLTKTAVTKTASARTMLTNGDYTVWASGPIATTIRLGNHAQGATCGGNAASVYDFGFDSFCAFRPLFDATFWAGTNQVSIRFIGELANTEQYEDMAVDSMQYTVGNTNPTPVYTRSTAITLHAGSRLVRPVSGLYWIGGTPPVVGINHNLAYLASTKALPNYNTSRTIAGSTITSDYSSWTSAAKDLNDVGIWLPSGTLGGGGGHPHVGPYPRWVVQYLYSGDYRSQEIAVGQANLFASLQMHLREGKSGKKLDRAGTVDGVGYPISVSSRPTLRAADPTASGQTTADKVTPVGTFTLLPWESSTGYSYWGNIVSHQPEIFYPLFVVTGEMFYLEEAQFFASFNAAYTQTSTNTFRDRGPTGVEGNIPDRGEQIFQTRGVGWAFRNRVETAFITPDSSPYKAYLEQLIADAIATWEGTRNITTGAYNGTTMWNWGRTISTISGDGQWLGCDLGGTQCNFSSPSPLHYWGNGNTGVCATSGALIIQDSSLLSCNSPWMEQYVMYALGRAKELGYSTAALVTWLGVNQIGALTDAGYNPWLAGAYRSSIVPSSGAYYTTWSAAKTGYTTAAQNATGFTSIQSGTGPDGNAEALIPATSFLTGETNGQTAWNWIATNLVATITGEDDPKWDIAPRVALSSSPTSSTKGAAAIKGRSVVH